MRLRNIIFKYGDILTKPKSKQKFDLITNIDVLEHIKDYRKVLKNFYFMLNKNGYLYIHTPHVNQKRIFSKFKTWEHEDHVREGFDLKIFEKELKQIGFKVVSKRYTFDFWGSLAWELNHILITKGFVMMGLFYPFCMILAVIDSVTQNKRGLAFCILVQK